MEIKLRFCPVCGKKLEVHPATDNLACFLHGDFLIKADGTVEFKPMK